MKHKIIIRIILLPLVSILFPFCGSKQTHDKENTENNRNAAAASTGSSECDLGIDLFNKHAAGRLIRDISLVYSQSNRIPEDLKQFYPAARDTWNSLLMDVKRNYTNSYSVTSLNKLTEEQIKDWRNKNLNDDQKFFLLLTEYKYGRYPSQTNDMETKLAWMENADPKRRMDASVSSGIKGNCFLSIEKIRNQLNPVFLPETIEECYK